MNRVYKRSGTLWEGCYRSCVVQEEPYLLACQRYIELNPVRATMVEVPEQYRWSSYCANALGEDSPLITPHPLYQALGAAPDTRQQAYRDLFRQHLDPVTIETIRKATNGNFSLGTDRFNDQIADTLGRRVVPGKPGRPPRS